MSRQPSQFDTLDARLLQCLQEDARQTHEQLGLRIGLSPTAVLRRIRRLRDTGVIGDEVVVLEPAKSGIGVTAIIQVSLRNEAVTNRAFGQRMTGLPAVSQCHYVTGSADFVLIAHFPAMTDFQAFVERHLERNKDVRRFMTHVVLRTDKRTLRLPIGDAVGS